MRWKPRRTVATRAGLRTGVDGNRTHQGLWVQPLNGFEDRGTHQASGHSLGPSENRRAAAEARQEAEQSRDFAEEIESGGIGVAELDRAAMMEPIYGRLADQFSVCQIDTLRRLAQVGLLLVAPGASAGMESCNSDSESTCEVGNAYRSDSGHHWLRRLFVLAQREQARQGRDRPASPAAGLHGLRKDFSENGGRSAREVPVLWRVGRLPGAGMRQVRRHRAVA